MANILITGSNGQLGSEIKEQSNQYNQFNFTFADVEELNITDVALLKGFFNNQKIDYIVNCAAYTAVDKAESDKKNAELVNILAVANLTKLAANFKIKLIHISTDYVFDGTSYTPYTETSATNPVSVYGLSKLRGETEALRYQQSIIIRASWLYSSFGKNFVKSMLALAKDRSEVGVVFDQVGCPTYARDLAETILHIISKSEENPALFVPGIYHYSNEGVCSWYDLAYEIIQFAGYKTIVKAIETKDYPTLAKRPAYSVFNKNKIKQTFLIEIPHWRESLNKCLTILKK
jgi:dTDP-4-dehydrorhamnose reductase